MSTADRLHPGGARGGDAGVALVWVALLVGVLLAMAGFAIDVGRWYLESGRLQNAADASALGGVVFMPGDPTEAAQVAHRIAADHGYAADRVDVEEGSSPGQLRVTIDEEVDNWFAALVGVGTTTITETAVAEYVGPVPMGSPDNELGNDPEHAGDQPDLFVGIAGPQNSKRNGDRYQTKRCDSGDTLCTGGSNTEYTQAGYTYAVRVSSVSGQPLRIQVYDPAWIDAGNNCDSGMPTSTERSALAALDEAVHGLPATWFDDAVERYRTGRTFWCTGDNMAGSVDQRTSYVVRAPDETPWRDDDNPVIDTATCRPTTMPSWRLSGHAAFEMLHPTSGPADGQWIVDPADGTWTFAEVFRRWVTVCEVPASQVHLGDYLVQIRTNASPAAPTDYDATVATSGQNFFSLRAGMASGEGVAPSGVSLFGRGRMAIYANVPGADTSFTLARVLPAPRDRTLIVEMFDVGDAAANGSIRVLPPADADISSFSGCNFTRDGGGSLTVNAGTCTLSNVRAANGYNGRTVTVEVPIPASYDCAETNPTGCWVTLLADFPSEITDFTTWSASIDGDPVRLVE